MILSDTAIRNRVTVFVLILLIVATGVVSYITLPREAAPDVPIPLILVNTTYGEVSPADVETTVTMKIEKELSGLKGVKEVRSTSAEGSSGIVIEFDPDIRIEEARQYVRDKVDLAKGQLPREADEPTLQEINVAEFPIMQISLSGDISPWRLKAIADDLEDAIENLPGVLNVDVLGALEREIRVEIDPDRTAAYGLTIAEVLSFVPSQNVNISAGGLETPGTKFNVRVPAEFADPMEMIRLPVTSRDGKVVYLTDVAEVKDVYKDRKSLSRLDGVENVTLAVQKRTGANLVAIADAVKAVLDEARRRAPKGLRIETIMDQSDDIRMMVSDLENNVVTGLILVVLVLMLFMGFRTSLIVALAIPLSMLISFSIIQALGHTLNMVVLFSLILALGMLVDNAIVIVENIFRHRQMGLGRIAAAKTGAGEVAWPVITSTATTVAAFTPLLFWPGIMGDFMKYVPITAIVTLTCSLFVALVISPTICSVVGGGARPRAPDSRFVAAYRRLLETALAHRGATITLMLLLMVALVVTYARRGAGKELFPQIDPRNAVINVRCPQGTSIQKTDDLVRIIEHRLKPFVDAGELKHVSANVGSAGGFTFSGRPTGPHVGNVTVVFQDYEDRRRPSARAVEEMRQAVADIAGAEIKVEKQREGPPTGQAVTVRIIGEDLGELERISDRAKRMIADVPGLVNLRSDLEATRPELAFVVDRSRAAVCGVTTNEVGRFLKAQVFGAEVGKFRQFNDEYDITIRLPLRLRERIEDLQRQQVLTQAGRSVPLSSLGRFEYRAGLGTVHRVHQKRVVTLSADAEGRLGEEVLKDVQAILDPAGLGQFGASDVAAKDWPAFCAALAGGAGAAKPFRDALGGSLAAWFGGGAAEAVRRVAETGAADADTRAAIASALSKALAKRDLWDEADLAGAALTDEARDLLARRDQLNDAQVHRLNRLGLEAAFAPYVRRTQAIRLPTRYTIAYAGEKEQQDEATQYLFGRALPMALLLIVMILVAQFNTLSAPLIIMVTVILSTIGVLVGLLVCNMPFGVVMTGVGVISLAGVVVNNAIVLLDCTRQLQRKGLDVCAAALQAGVRRLRPVLLTATTTILGLVPMATGVSIEFGRISLANPLAMINTRSETSQFWAGMAIAVIFGLAFATILTLIVVPTLYAALYGLAARFGLGGLKKAGNGEAPPDLAVAEAGT